MSKLKVTASKTGIEICAEGIPVVLIVCLMAVLVFVFHV